MTGKYAFTLLSISSVPVDAELAIEISVGKIIKISTAQINIGNAFPFNLSICITGSPSGLPPFYDVAVNVNCILPVSETVLTQRRLPSCPTNHGSSGGFCAEDSAGMVDNGHVYVPPENIFIIRRLGRLTTH